ncbi:MAG: TIGR00153 family protein [Halioglobus sp.]|nr:TIGR00153 family protein [Halioglobus sp.]
MAILSPIGNLFGRSPIGPIQEHMALADQAAQLLPALFRAMAADDWDSAKQVHKDIVSAESAADKMKRSVRKHLPNNLFLPVPRSDLLTLVGIQDHVANTAKDIAGLVIGRSIRFPEKLQDAAVELAEASAATSGQALSAIQELDELLAVGFTGQEEVRRVEDMLKTLDKLERASDKMAIKMRAALFKLEKDLPPVEVMFLYQIISLVCTVADDAEAAGDRLQILMAK